MSVKTACEGCGILHRKRGLIIYDNKLLCYTCRCKTSSYRISDSAATIGKPMLSLQAALNRVYHIKGYTNKNGRLTCPIIFPSILAEKDIRITLVSQSPKSIDEIEVQQW